jgi:hypothetical protein
MNLAYYTLGFDIKYLDLLHLSIRSLRKYNINLDVLIICDKSMLDQCVKTFKEFKNLKIVSSSDSLSAMNSSIKKLTIFNYNILNYKKVLFIDSDILVDINLDDIFKKFEDDTKLYAFAEYKHLGFHNTKYHSLLNYTFEDYAFFEKNQIYPFNCGLFGFVNSGKIKQHFSNILKMINTYKGEYWYEQSFMNVYFNKLNLVDTTVINESNCLMNIDITKVFPQPWQYSLYRNKIFHFCFVRGAEKKLKEMIWWKTKFIPEK